MRVLAVGLVLAFGAIGLVLLRPVGQATQTNSGGPTDTPGPSPTYDTRFDWASPITHGAFAVTRSAELLRSLGWEPSDVTSHLISFATYAAWQGSVIDSPYPQGPVWLVAFNGPGLTMDKVNDDIGAQLGHAPSSAASSGVAAPPVEGIYYAWDATSGSLIGKGALIPGTAWTYASVAAMTDIVAAIEPATPMPSYPTADPTFFMGPNSP
jgi:hypothetical protein